MLGQVFPRPPMQQRAYARPAKAMFPSQLRDRDVAEGEPLTDCLYGGRRQLSSTMSLSMNQPSTLKHILDVLPLAAVVDVARVGARWVIAVVKDILRRIHSKMNKICHSVCAQRTPLSIVIEDQSVALVITKADPFPASVWVFRDNDSGPVQGCQDILVLHRLTPGVSPWTFARRRGTLLPSSIPTPLRVKVA